MGQINITGIFKSIGTGKYWTVPWPLPAAQRRLYLIKYAGAYYTGICSDDPFDQPCNDCTGLKVDPGAVNWLVTRLNNGRDKSTHLKEGHNPGPLLIIFPAHKGAFPHSPQSEFLPLSLPEISVNQNRNLFSFRSQAPLCSERILFFLTVSRT